VGAAERIVNLHAEWRRPKARTGWISLGLLKLAIDPGDKLFIVTGAGYCFRLVAEKKHDFGNALQNLYRELERAEDLVGPG
jgi:hypothetical protein